MKSRKRAGVVLTIAAVRALACAPEPDGIRTSPSEYGGAGEASAEPTWCDVRAVLAAKCWRCHTEPPRNGAPFALATYEATQVVDGRGVPRYERMYDAVEAKYMPATFVKLDPPVEERTDAERSTILEWAGAGGLAGGGTSCER